MEPVTLVAAAGLALFLLLRRAGWFSPVLASAEGPSNWAPAKPRDDEEQQPETDRAPKYAWLPVAVASIAVVRVALLLTLHA